MQTLGGARSQRSSSCHKLQKKSHTDKKEKGMTHTYQLIEANIPMEGRTQDKEKREKKKDCQFQNAVCICFSLLFFSLQVINKLKRRILFVLNYASHSLDFNSCSAGCPPAYATSNCDICLPFQLFCGFSRRYVLCLIMCKTKNLNINCPLSGKLLLFCFQGGPW